MEPLVPGQRAHQPGRFDEGLALLRDSVAVQEQLKTHLARPMFLAVLADGLRQAERVDEGLAMVDQGFAFAARTGEGGYVAELHRVRGQLLQLRGDLAGAEASLREALAYAGRQTAKSLELRAARRWPACCATRGAPARDTPCWHRCMAGSRRVSPPRTWWLHGPCCPRWDDGTMATMVSGGRRVEFERPRPTEEDDIQEIVRGILAVQAQFAQAEHGPLERGTHAKGVCARAVFEVLDIRHGVRDPRLAARLARGLFAQPGTYAATVRFANASGQVRSDAIRDVRALSFSVEVPPGLVSPTITRLDFSANSAPIFPINDTHAFATLMRVLSAGGTLAKLRTLWSLPLKDLLALGRIGLLGALQTKQPVRAYQELRYWSTVPFRHGADEAIK